VHTAEVDTSDCLKRERGDRVEGQVRWTGVRGASASCRREREPG